MNYIYVLVCMVIVSTLSVCAINGTNISQNWTVTIERIDSKKLFIPWADTYEDGNNLTIRGVIEQRYHFATSLKAHVDVTIIDSNGQLLKEAKTAKQPVFLSMMTNRVSTTILKAGLKNWHLKNLAPSTSITALKVTPMPL